MKCQRCSAPATVHLTKLVNNQKTELHLCQNCAEEQKLVQKKELSVPAIVQALLGQHVAPELDELSRLVCPHCGIGFMELRNEGRVGCPFDYDVFQAGLEPLLKRIHRSLKHEGKVPLRDPKALEVVVLQQELQRAIEAERYEEAARLRDLLREKEAGE